MLGTSGRIVHNAPSYLAAALESAGLCSLCQIPGIETVLSRFAISNAGFA